MSDENPAGPATSKRVPSLFRTLLYWSPLFLVMILVSPITDRLANVAQLQPWPESDYKFANMLYENAAYVLMIWLTLTIISVAMIFILFIVFLFTWIRSKKNPSKRPAWRLLVVFIVASLISAATVLINFQLDFLRDPGLTRITFAAQPLLKAIDQYKHDIGEYPTEIHALIPKYLDRIPYTGAVGYPNFEYYGPQDYSEIKTFELRVHVPATHGSHDWLIYWPEMVYPPDLYGSHNVVPITDWAYVPKH